MNKCKKFLIADSLREWSENSITEFIDESKDEELIKIAKEHNILIPSPDISIFKTIYARVDVPNKNNVVITKEAAIKGLPSLISKQINLEHQGSGYVCGFILDSKLEGDFIIIYGCFYKSLFQEKFEQLKQLIKEKKASVSFEIWNIDPVTKKSVVKEKENGIKEINPVLFHGCGLLLEHEPACKEAYLSKLLAKEENKKDRIFFEELVYATLTIKEECVKCGKCNYKKEESKVDLTELYSKVTKEEEITFEIAMAFYYATNEEQSKVTEDAAKWTRKFINGLPDSAFAAIEPAYPEKVEDKNCRHLPHHKGEGDLGKDKSNTNLDLPHYKNALARVNQIKPVSDSISVEDLQKKAGNHLERHKDALEKSSEEPKTDGQSTETKPIEGAETKVDDKPKVEETKEVKAQDLEVIEPKVIVKVTRIYSEVTVDTYIDGTPSGTHEVSGHSETITEYKDGTKDEVKSEVEIKKTYTFAELEEAVKKAKEELATLHIAELEAKTNEVKVDLEKKISDKETEIATLKKELDAKAQEVAELKKPKVEEATVEESPVLDVGAVIKIKEDTYTKIHDEVDEKAFGKKKDKKS